MKYFLVGLFSLLLATSAFAANEACSGKKGGISHCSGTAFVCKDGSISKSKRTCDPEIHGTAPKKKAPAPKKK